MKTHANLICTYLNGCYGPAWKFGGVKKRCENAQKRCEMVDIKEFSNKNLQNPYIGCT